MKMNTYIPAPRRVKAIQLTSGNIRLIVDWINDAGESAEMVNIGAIVNGDYGIRLSTPWCTVIVQPGDWIVQAIDEPDDFEAVHAADFASRYTQLTSIDAIPYDEMTFSNDDPA